MNPLDENSLQEGVDFLVKKHKYFKKIVEDFGPPPLWQREQGFHTLVRIILEQQVSLKSAKAAYDKLEFVIDQPKPVRFLKLTDEKLKSIGFSRQKTKYCRELAQNIIHGNLDVSSLHSMGDEEVAKELTKVKGIGPWTANIYLLMALGRPDVWPKGDLALEVGFQHILKLPAKPTADELAQISTQWRPWRAVAARLIYHFYLNS